MERPTTPRRSRHPPYNPPRRYQDTPQRRAFARRTLSLAPPLRTRPDMCGFAGVVAWDDRYRVDRETLRRMSARIAHRGPDGEGLYLNHEQEATPDRPR